MNFESWKKVQALSRVIVIDGLRRNAVFGLVLLALAAEVCCLLYMDLIGRDIGRASSDFIFSIGWLTGMILIFFHAVQKTSWGDDRGGIFFMLSRPVSRSEYVMGMFLGLMLLLLVLNLIIGSLGWAILMFVRHSVGDVYFPVFSNGIYLLSWFGLFMMELTILAVVMLFSGLVRGSFSVMLVSLCFYFTCSGLPVVRESFVQKAGGEGCAVLFFKVLALFFPSFDRLDFKSFVVYPKNIPNIEFILTTSSISFLYIVTVLLLTCMVYIRRDLQ